MHGEMADQEVGRGGSLSHFRDGVLGRFRKHSAHFFLNKNAW